MIGLVEDSPRSSAPLSIQRLVVTDMLTGRANRSGSAGPSASWSFHACRLRSAPRGSPQGLSLVPTTLRVGMYGSIETVSCSHDQSASFDALHELQIRSCDT